jgi:lipoprotein-releasing system ATP-binding protein
MRQAKRDGGTGFLVVTHNPDLGRRCDRIIEAGDGHLQP